MCLFNLLSFYQRSLTDGNCHWKTVFSKNFIFPTVEWLCLLFKGNKTAIGEGDSSVWIISDDESVGGKDEISIIDSEEMEKSKRKLIENNQNNTECIKIYGICLKNYLDNERILFLLFEFEFEIPRNAM